MKIDRRDFIKTSALSLGALMLPSSLYSNPEELDTFIKQHMEKIHIPGLGACIVKDNSVIWSQGYGWANIEKKIPYDPEKTVQNIGSVSKTITAAAVLQLWELGLFQLDDDVNEYLEFSVRNPRFPDTPLTFRQLLTHRSSIQDGPAYGDSYTCGDPTISLETWLSKYFTAGQKYYDAEENFHVWKPGQTGELPAQPRAYSNIGFGLLGHLVERIAKISFAEYCRLHIFEPLAMSHTSWYLKDLDQDRHALPYTYIPAGGTQSLIRPEGQKKLTSESGEFASNCLYSFPNYPDGLVRTSVLQLSHFLLAHINHGVYENTRILKQETIETMFSQDHFGKGLCWSEHSLADGNSLWVHGGVDPGINTVMVFRPADKTGVIIFANNDNADLGTLLQRLLQAGIS